MGLSSSSSVTSALVFGASSNRGPERPVSHRSIALFEVAKDCVQLILEDLQGPLLDPEFLLDHEIHDTLAVEEDDGHGSFLDRRLRSPFREIRRGEEQALFVLSLNRPPEL